MFPFKRIAYEELNSRQQENFNFQKVSAVLADYGFTTIRLTDDWNGADFLALRTSGETLKIQLKGRLTFDKKYEGRDIWLCFPSREQWYLFPHDEVLKRVFAVTDFGSSESWVKAGGYSVGNLSQQLQALLEPWRISAQPAD